MREAFEWAGMWWLPNDAENKIAGTLRYTPGEYAILELFSTFNKKYSNPIIILGVTKKADPVTLYQCMPPEDHSIYSTQYSYESSTFRARFIFQGYHFETEDSVQFNSISVKYFNLEEWSQNPGKRWNVVSRDGNFDFKIANRPKDKRTKLNNLTLALQHNFVSSFSSTERSTLQISSIRFISRRKLHFNAFDEFWHTFGIFLSFAIGQAAHPITIEGNRQDTRMPILIYGPLSIEISEQKISSYEMLLPFEHIVDEFADCVKKWFEKSERLEPIYNLYAATLYHPSTYLDQKFLTLTQAIEAYHRRMHDEGYVKDEIYQELYDSIIDTIPSDTDKKLVSGIERSLKFANRLNLRERFNRIWRDEEQYIKLVVNNRKEYNAFTNNIVNTRNYLTHYDETGKDSARTKPDQLLRMSNFLRFLMEMYFLIELGLSASKISEALTRSTAYKRLKWKG